MSRSAALMIERLTQQLVNFDWERNVIAPFPLSLEARLECDRVFHTDFVGRMSGAIRELPS
jgi:hypothetical protein